MKLVFFLFLLLAHTNAQGATYYVSVGGNNANDGSLASPWRTLVHAVRTTRPGDTVLVREGTYTDHEIWIRDKFGWGGVPGRMKTIAAYPGEKPVIRSRNGLQIYASWIRIQGFRFYDEGITSNLGDGNIVENVEVLDNHFIGNFQYGAIELIGSNLLIADNTIEITEQKSEMDHGIYLHAGKNNVVRGNRITNPQGFGIHVYDERKRNYSEQQLREGFQNIVIEDNFVSGSKGASGIVAFGFSTIRS
jgi:parallel beta-helix repeat protein